MDAADQAVTDFPSAPIEALTILRALLKYSAPILSSNVLNDEHKETLRNLFVASARSSESTILLCLYGQVWDAEMVARSAIEASVKLCYLLQDQATFEKRHTEYSTILPQFDALRDDGKVRELLSCVDALDDEWRPMRERLLSNEEKEALEQSYPKEIRRRLPQEWGFTRIIGSMSRSGDPLFSGMMILAVGYSMSSHIQHASSIGVTLPIERDLRSLDRRSSIHEAHSMRLITDIFAAAWLRLAVAYRFIDRDVSLLEEAFAPYNAFKQKIESVTTTWREIEYGV